ncbi:hypothetical protein Dsin_022297 [Dipteronia sinensis]|uniref:Reverse transcriptase n=1 Tax=Dipteronia sinensis TaxID=43782 RepID=A0AAE0E110_9ROSI|nr:hypothetical protein Dsin_022297 [Dipteronia sinensis]
MAIENVLNSGASQTFSSYETKYLSYLVNQAVRKKEITGFKCSSIGPIISHLLFADDSLLFAKATPSNCVSIRLILDCYTKASDQAGQWNVTEKYLGLPCFTGRHKRKIFNDISKRVWDKIKGWRDKFLSAGGKEVLIKGGNPVDSYLYYESFLAAKRTSERKFIDSGLDSDGESSQDKQKIHWYKWSRLCDSKGKGGLSFKDLETFNKALLAKQCWRILKNKNSLAARVLKGCYFSDREFMEAEIKPTGSFIWKSLGWGREIIVAGSRWRVGNGSKIRIYKDHWIPRPTTFRPLSPTFVDENAMVSQLITPSGGWNI